MRSLLTLVCLVALAACDPDTAPAADGAEPSGSNAEGDAARNPAASTDPVMADTSDVDYTQPVELVSMENGDRACYLTVRPDGEPERTDMADFGLCERTELVGQRVSLTVTPSEVMAESCQGDPECADKETVSLVTGMDPVEGAAAAETTEG